MPPPTVTWNYCESGELDKRIEEEQAIEIQYGLSKIVENELKDHTHVAKVAVELLKRFLPYQCYHVISVYDCMVDVISGKDAVQCTEEYLTEKYWEDVFSKETCSIAYWNTMFVKDSYVTIDVGGTIPDNKYQRMVFHFVHKWTKLRDFLIHTDIPEDKKVTVIMKQLENIVFFSRKRLFGSIWLMNSKPDEYVRQALSAHGTEVTVLDDKMEKEIETIMGQKVRVSIVGNISPRKAEGAKPDKIDERLYKSIIVYAYKTHNITIFNEWTMVRASFKRKTDGKEIRCYAFSGTNADKLQHRIPFEYWRYHKFDHYKEDMDIFVCNIDEQLVAQNMIVSIFNALKPFVLEDLRKLTQYIAFEDYHLAQSTVGDNRSDMTTLDYGEYFDSVIKFLNSRDKTLQRIIATVLKKKTNAIELLQEIWTMVSVGGKNQCFVPKEEDLEKILGKETAKIIIKVSKEQLADIKSKLDDKPMFFLSEIKKVLLKCQCGEDNVLSLLLSKYLKYTDVFLLSPVEFVALDGNNLSGKPFCEACDRKVRFYSVLPSFLSELGLKSEDIDGNGDISKQLAVLFEKLAKRKC